ncbi:hypothetical protein KFK09_013429 [Dendrobium nobile]|uniref:Uncharacterized protein n=1 Tax=Dendrobium nobile TaxID=94219 RepID=A0A8T3B7E6_DENNO|nr:hypothetical protein KFK09_013429 [Dendrobium nobile]
MRASTHVPTEPYSFGPSSYPDESPSLMLSTLPNAEAAFTIDFVPSSLPEASTTQADDNFVPFLGGFLSADRPWIHAFLLPTRRTVGSFSLLSLFLAQISLF